MWPRVFDPRRAARRAVEAARRAVGEKLRGATLYGSAVSSEFHPAHSDVNVAFVFSTLLAPELSALSRAHGAWRRCRVVRPLLLSEDTLRRSLDTFPLEYLLIRERHETIYGEDSFGALALDRDALRLEVERVLRGQELGLGLSYVALAGTRGGARRWALQASTAIASSASGLLYLSGEPIPGRRVDLAQRCAARFGVDAEAFARLLTLREARHRPADALELLDSAQRILRQLLESAERMSAPPQKP
jgi:hypothetical protein